MTSTRVAVITIASGRHEHLRQQRRGLARNERGADIHVVISMNDPELPDVAAAWTGDPRVVVQALPSKNGRLHLATARNHGAAVAISQGAEILIFLDVDCIPGPRLVERYTVAVTEASTPALFSGPVSYLLPPAPEGYDLDTLSLQTSGHPARPVPDENAIVSGADHRLFWSLSFALSASTWTDLGGFCETYEGYGAEDTDFGQMAAQRGVGHHWVGGAWAYHQHHPTSDPPVQHLHDILHNAGVFKDRWGWWPMQGWLTSFQRMGLAFYDRRRDLWTAEPVDAVDRSRRSPRPGDGLG